MSTGKLALKFFMMKFAVTGSRGFDMTVVRARDLDRARRRAEVLLTLWNREANEPGKFRLLEVWERTDF